VDRRVDKEMGKKHMINSVNHRTSPNKGKGNTHRLFKTARRKTKKKGRKYYIPFNNNPEHKCS
jgi:hypothetical protein